MGLLVTIPFETEDDDEIDVILHKKEGGDDSFEIVDFDIERAETAQALGFDAYDDELALYEAYENHGLALYIRKYLGELDIAFSGQGYDVFEDGAFSQEQFLNAVGQNIRDDAGYTVDNIAFLRGAVEAGDYEKSELVEDLIEGLKTVVDPDKMHWSDEGLASDIMLPLLWYLPIEAFKFYKKDPRYEDADSNSLDMQLDYEIVINDEHIIEWPRKFNIFFVDPITFKTDIREYDFDEDNPIGPHAIMKSMGWEYPPLPDYQEPYHPDSDEDGRFGVQYLKHGREKAIIPYETLVEASSAAELSMELFKQRGMEDDYAIVFLERVGGSNWFPLKEVD